MILFCVIMKNIQNAYDVANFVYQSYSKVVNQILSCMDINNSILDLSSNQKNDERKYNFRIKQLMPHCKIDDTIENDSSIKSRDKNNDIKKYNTESQCKQFYAMQLFKIYDFQRVVIQIDYLPDAQKTPALQDMFDGMVEKLPDFYIPLFLKDLLPSKYNGYYSFVSHSAHIKHIEMIFNRSIQVDISFDMLL
ncbi:MAG: hypothetical protein RL208_77, partial [Pseudomonadota bacterium]